MHTLKGIAIEGGAVIATDRDGTNFRVEIDDVLRSRLRETTNVAPIARKLSPREIQTQIRAGMTASQVAEITGAPLDYIQRYEGPVLAERQYVVESALGVPVRAIDDEDPEASVPTFGGVMADRLVQLSADEPEWSSWKEEAGGWVLRLAFTADDIDHDARWRFDPKKLVLAPLNAEAVALSQAGEIGATLLPRLRAVPAASSESTRFDSGAFEPVESTPEAEAEKAEMAFTETVVTHEPLKYGRGRVIEPRTGAISLAPEKPEPSETSDLLEALRRRRGEREASSFDDAPRTEEPPRTGTATVRVLDRQRNAHKGEPAEQESQVPAAGDAPKPVAVENRSADARANDAAKKVPSSETMPIRPARRGRTSMPSWDEIVFGARSDED